MTTSQRIIEEELVVYGFIRNIQLSSEIDQIIPTTLIEICWLFYYVTGQEFYRLKYFFKFIYNEFHANTKLIINTSLPRYSEYKQQRKVRIRNYSLKYVDDSLKAYWCTLQKIQALIHNSIVLFFDENQPKKQLYWKQYNQSSMQLIPLNVGNYSIMSVYDLFDNELTPSINDWTQSLNLNEGIAQKLSAFWPDFDNYYISKAHHNGKICKLNIIASFLHENEEYLKFDADPIEWKLIKSKFMETCSVKLNDYNNDLLNGFDHLTYFINPPLHKACDLLSDVNQDHISKNRIIVEPILWLFYMISLLADRQEKLQNLYTATMTYEAPNGCDNVTIERLNTFMTNLGGKAKEEREALSIITSKLPPKEGLKETLMDRYYWK